MLYVDKGFVVKKSDLLNEDKIIELFLQNHGKISCVAKGVKKVTSRKAGNLDLLNLCQFSLATGKSLDILTEVRLINEFPKIKNDEKKAFFLFYIDEVIHTMVYDGEISKDMFDVLETTLLFLEDYVGFSLEKLAIFLNAKLILYSGVFPEMYQCIICGEKVKEADELIFLYSGVAHASCRVGEAISTGMIKTLRFFKENTIEKAMKIAIPLDMEKSLFLLTISIIEYTIGSSIRSKIYVKTA